MAKESRECTNYIHLWQKNVFAHSWLTFTAIKDLHGDMRFLWMIVFAKYAFNFMLKYLYIYAFIHVSDVSYHITSYKIIVFLQTLHLNFHL